PLDGSGCCTSACETSARETAARPPLASARHHRDVQLTLVGAETHQAGHRLGLAGPIRADQVHELIDRRPSEADAIEHAPYDVAEHVVIRIVIGDLKGEFEVADRHAAPILQ